jgi:hypothetical protein
MLITFGSTNNVKQFIMKAKERGSASMRIDLRGATITVYHGSTNEVLKTFTAYEGAWETIWEGINNAKNL